MPIRSQMSLIMEQIKPEHLELYALEYGKIAETDFVYTLASTNIDQSAPNLVKMYVTIKSQMSSIIDVIGLELLELFALEFAKITESDFCLHSSIYRWVQLDRNNWSYLVLNCEKLLHSTLFTL